MLLPKTSNVNIAQIEKDFQIALDLYWHTDITKHTSEFYKQQTEKMWWCVYYTCANLCKKIYKERNVIVQDLDEVIVDSTEYTMRFILGKNRLGRVYLPRSLKSFCFLRCRHIIDDVKRQWYDQNIVPMPQDNYRDIDMEVEENYGCY